MSSVIELREQLQSNLFKRSFSGIFDTIIIYLYFYKRYPLASSIIIIALLIAGILESIGILSLAPLLEFIISGNDSDISEISKIFIKYYENVGLTLTLKNILLFIVFVITLKSLLIFLTFSYVGYVTSCLTRDLRDELINSSMCANWSFILKHKVGRFTNAVSNEAGSAVGLYRSLSEYIAFALKATIFFITAFAISWVVTLGAMISGIIFWMLLHRLVKIGRKAGDTLAKKMKVLSENVADGIGAIKVFKAMGVQQRIIDLLERDSSELKKAQWRLITTSTGLKQIYEPMSTILIASALYILSDSIVLTSSTLLMLLALFHRLFGLFGNLQTTYLNILAKEEYFWLFMDLREKCIKEKESHTGDKEPSLSKKIVFKDVTFKYHESDILVSTSTEIIAGKITALVGPSGVGKTTIADILCGLQKINSGNILIDDIPIDEVDMKKWRNKIGYVTQDSTLFHDSILSNITLHENDISKEQVEMVIRQAGAWEFISNLEHGLNTLVGERGLRFSGGQKQRIAIARALVRKPKLLILDEATTGLDPDTERSICQTIKSLTPGITILFISHQSGILKIADYICKLENGKFSPV